MLTYFLFQEWLYDEGEDVTKAVYIAKMEELRGIVGPIAQRYFDKEEEKRQAEREKQEAAAMRKAQEEMAKRQAEKKDGPDAEKDAEKQQPAVEEMDIE